MAGVIEEFFLVMPEVPSVHMQLQKPGSGMGYGGLGGAIVYSGNPQPPRYYTFKGTREDAHAYAKECSKNDGHQYYIARLVIEGSYAPPPPAFIRYESYGGIDPNAVWNKPVEKNR